MRHDRDQPVWGRTGGDRGPAPLLIVGAGVVLLVAFVGLAFLIAALLRAGVAGGSPLATVIGLGCLVVLFLGGAIGLLLGLAQRFAAGGTARRAVVIGGLGVLMGFAPALMILVIYLLARAEGP